MVRTRQPTIERATTVLDEEVALVETERDAFERFLGRLRDVQPTGFDAPDPGGGGPTVLAAGETAPSSGLRRIRRAYRETVMATPHYEREYGDTLAGSLAEELGETLAVHVVDGQLLTPPVHGALVDATERTLDDRAEFLEQLRRERRSLRTTEAELDEIEARLAKLDERITGTDRSTRLSALDETLADLERRCDDLATRRQEQIHNRRVGKLSGVDAVSLAGYLYGDMETTTPALADTAACLRAVRHQRTRCLR
jgi:hypothetical protein